MDRRLIFPLTMFALAAVSFAYGTWQYVYARRVQASADARVTHILQRVDQMPVTDRAKQDLYAAVFREYPESPTFLGLDLSGSFASQQDDDRCASDGQRSVCRALEESGADPVLRAGVCGSCDPR